jgi:Bacteriophage Mu Gam like protein
MTAPTEHPDTPDGADEETGELPWDGFRDGRIQSFLGLDWAGKKLADLDRAIAENLAAFDAEHARRVARLKELQAPLAKARLFWLNAIESYAKEHKSELLIGRSKSRETPSGLVLKWRERKTGEYRWDQSKTPAENKAALLAWALKEQADGRVANMDDPLVKPGPDVPDKDRIVEYLEAIVSENHEPRQTPPGLEWVEPGEVLTVTTKGESK